MVLGAGVFQQDRNTIALSPGTSSAFGWQKRQSRNARKTILLLHLWHLQSGHRPLFLFGPVDNDQPHSPTVVCRFPDPVFRVESRSDPCENREWGNAAGAVCPVPTIDPPQLERHLVCSSRVLASAHRYPPEHKPVRDCVVDPVSHVDTDSRSAQVFHIRKRRNCAFWNRAAVLQARRTVWRAVSSASCSGSLGAKARSRAALNARKSRRVRENLDS